MPEVNQKPLDVRVHRLIDAGAPVGDAVRIALARQLRAEARSGITVFADKHALARANTSAAIYGKRPAPAELLSALVEELGGSVREWAELLWHAAKPQALSA